jgi:hypothetical protein
MYVHFFNLVEVLKRIMSMRNWSIVKGQLCISSWGLRRNFRVSESSCVRTKTFKVGGNF